MNAVTLQTSTASRNAATVPALSNQRWALLAIWYLSLSGFAWLAAQTVQYEQWWWHGAWCVLGILPAAPTLLRVFRRNFSLVMTDHRIMFLTSFSLYFLFGASLLAFGPTTQIEQSLSYYAVGADDALRVDAMNGFGFGLALLMATIARGRWLERVTVQVSGPAKRIPEHIAITLFLLLGGGFSIYILIYDLGFEHGIIPGIERQAARFALAAIVLAVAYKGQKDELLRTAAAILALGLSLAGLLQFNKIEVLLPIAAFAAGAALRYGPRKVLPIAIAVMTGTFLVIGNLTAYGRATLGSDSAASFTERWEILLEGWHETKGLSESEEYATWSRLCYVPAQVAAMDFWKAGQGGDGFELLPWVLVPRFVAPNKPEITKTGREFHNKITGRDSSSTGQGIFASGYYHGGFFGLIIASLLCGWVVAQTSAIARGVQKGRGLALLPFQLLGLFIAFRIDGDFVSDYAGAFVFLLYPLLAGYLLVSARVRRGERSVGTFG